MKFFVSGAWVGEFALFVLRDHGTRPVLATRDSSKGLASSHISIRQTTGRYDIPNITLWRYS